MLLSSGMHAIAFGAKRAFHSFVRVARKPLRSWPGLTAARFDLMSAFYPDIDTARPEFVELRQNELRQTLGVCASVVSRMVSALLERGWIARRRAPEDRRAWHLSLTPTGKHVIRSARRLLRRAMDRLVIDALCPVGRRPLQRFSSLFNFTFSLSMITCFFDDSATLEYLWWYKPLDD